MKQEEPKVQFRVICLHKVDYETGKMIHLPVMKETDKGFYVDVGLSRYKYVSKNDDYACVDQAQAWGKYLNHINRKLSQAQDLVSRLTVLRGKIQKKIYEQNR